MTTEKTRHGRGASGERPAPEPRPSDTGDLGAPLGIPVLLVEDEEPQVELMLRALRGLDVPVTPKHVPSLAVALAEVGRRDYDLVLLDLHLPDAAGIEAVELMCQHHDNVIVLTGSGPRLERQAIQAGADDYVSKDAAPAEIRHAVRCALERRLRRRRLTSA